MTETGQQNGESPAAEVPRFTLAEYVGTAGRAVRQSLPAKAWVEAVILDAKAGRAGLSLELIEPFADARNNAFLRCFVGERTRGEIESAIGEKLDVATLKGAHARLLLKPGFHPRYHLEGEVIGLDPTLVESLVARRIEAIRRTLRTEGLFDAQSKLPTPVDITSVAVIHPDKSAGWADVQTELERLQAGGILTLASYPTQFEGNRAAFGIGEALRQILVDAAHRPDLILIVRGGGAAAGLASLADLALARAVCCCPVPIVTGLGHASDRTLLDEIAWRAADTPSKSLGVTKSILRRRCEMATSDHRTVVTAMDRLVVQTLAPLLEAWSATLVEVVCRITTREAATLRNIAHQIECHVIRFRGEIATTQADLDRLAAGLLDIAPRVPRDAAIRTKTLYRGVVRFSRLRVPGNEALVEAAHQSGSAAASFLARRSGELNTAFGQLEVAVRRRLGDEAARLVQAKASVEALDATATLRRGFVLPLDAKRRIVRTAEAAHAATHLELLFTDGIVACRPVSHS